MAGVNRMSMMEQVHLAGEDEDDVYGGFNDYNATLDTDVSSKVDESIKIVFMCIVVKQVSLHPTI